MGTLIAIAFRLIYLVWYLHKDMIMLSYASLSRYIVTFVVTFVVNLFVYIACPIKVNNVIHFLFVGCTVFVAECGFCGLLYWINRRLFQTTKNGSF